MDIEEALDEHGDVAAYVADILYGDAYEVFKSALSVEEKRARRELLQTRLSQASNVVGLAAGLSAMPGAVRDTKAAYREYKKIPKDQRPKRKLKLSPKSFLPKSTGGKVALGVAGGNLALQGLNLAGDGLTGLVLNRTAKKTAKEVSKSDRDDFGVYCEISKVDTDKRQVFGWASISKKDGKHVEDLQGDAIDTDELEKAAYNYMLKSRKGGHEHLKGEEGPVHVSDIIESMVVTAEKKKAMGLPDDMPEGWWVGFKVHDDEVWELAKSGELAGFSIHGSGRRVPA